MSDVIHSLRDCLAPAKLNLFLHITGRYKNGYHSLQTVFQLLNWGDILNFSLREDGRIARSTNIPNISEENDLTVRAAYLLKTYTGTMLGVNIEIDKRLPIGAGLGGGSSDAATTLLALNRLWRLNLVRAQLHSLAVKLGADVPFFVYGKNAFGEGIGENLTEVELPSRWFLILIPDVHISTAEIFSDNLLPRNIRSISIFDFLSQKGSDIRWPDNFGYNSIQQLVENKYTKIAYNVKWLCNFAPARITGSGASVFATFRFKHEAEAVQAKLPTNWIGNVVESLNEHPLFNFAS
ncbi:MAG: 4-(cytidine 5'-diphospho)-2-C-methyl-D-erythritol kinase [Burkholderia sp.]|nr:4-(cytidine 5'-diphospho)-2-C-methyl-D-erythritol kinase [Burkholderia sp.]